MVWFGRFVLLIVILIAAMSSWAYGKTGEMAVLIVGIFALIGAIICVCLFAETRYNQGFVDGMRWLKKLWGK